MSVDKVELAKQYVPILELDEHEPFLPVAVGVTVLDRSAPSPSFRRELLFDHPDTKHIIEYALYWDYDIQHLYDLEHIWIFIGKDGKVIDCEASFHGKYFKGLLADRSNLEGNRVRLYCQAGKHAFSPLKELFPLIPNFRTATFELVGADGLIVTGPFDGILESNPVINKKVYHHLQQYRFRPSERYRSYVIPEHLLMSWDQLREVIPVRVEKQLQII